MVEHHFQRPRLQQTDAESSCQSVLGHMEALDRVELDAPQHQEPALSANAVNKMSFLQLDGTNMSGHASNKMTTDNSGLNPPI